MENIFIHCFTMECFNILYLLAKNQVLEKQKKIKKCTNDSRGLTE